jgi:lysylphosphatidylglycerol synthetase-like protein (DUF2156 family)
MTSFIRRFEASVQATALVPIGFDDLWNLSRALQRSPHDDPFSRSAGYFAMTGRKGLWRFGDDSTFMMIARHPNKPRTILLFPPVGQEPSALLGRAMTIADALPPGNRELARLNPTNPRFTRLLAKHRTVAGREDTLDWAYPVHVVDPPKIVERKGKPFVSFRGHINRALRNGLQSQAINPARHRDDVTSIIDRWADSRRDGRFTRTDLTGPTHAVLDLMDRSGLDIRGTISRDRHGNPIGFWLWEQVGNTAMSLVRAYLKQPGNAEFGILAMAEQLKASGVPEMCLGGSETADLDAFKRKMQPIRSIALGTAMIDVPQPLAVPNRRGTMALARG